MFFWSGFFFNDNSVRHDAVQFCTLSQQRHPSRRSQSLHFRAIHELLREMRMFCGHTVTSVPSDGYSVVILHCVSIKFSWLNWLNATRFPRSLGCAARADDDAPAGFCVQLSQSAATRCAACCAQYDPSSSQTHHQAPVRIATQTSDSRTTDED